MKKFKNLVKEIGIEWIVYLVISELTYEEYISLGKYSRRGYFSFRDMLFSILDIKCVGVKYDYKKSRRLVIEQVEKFRNDKSDCPYFNFVEGIKNNLLI